ncbi:MAG: hypothetical protein ACFN0J_10315, partial [Segatella salivae]
WQPWAIKSATPTALKYLIHNMIYVISRLILWWITSKKHNTYGVEKFISYHDSYFFAPEFMVDYAEKAQHLWRCFPQTKH